MERKDWVMVGGFVGTILTITVVFFAGLQTMNSRFEAVDRRFVAIENRLLSIEEHLRGSDTSTDDAASANRESIPWSHPADQD